MTTPTPPAHDLLDALAERLRLTREHEHPSGGSIPLTVVDGELEHLVTTARRVEVLERLVTKLAGQVPHGTALLLLPAEAMEYDQLLMRSAATVAEATAEWLVTP